MIRIRGLDALEILDSRGRPTVRASCELERGIRVSASVPSGASTGRAEAHELRDGDPERYGGLGCRRAVANVRGPIADAVVGRRFASQAELDETLIALDGTPNKSRLGANAILAVSVAFARATAEARGLPLYQALAELVDAPADALPRLTINLFSGGKHAGGQVAIQDALVVPLATTIDDCLADAYAVYQAAIQIGLERYGARPLRADEGGLAPPFPTDSAMLADAEEAIRRAGMTPGKRMALAVDVAASHFYVDGSYHLDGANRTAAEVIERISAWVDRHPIISVEDGLAEDDWEHWPALRRELRGRALTLGDDFLCTNSARVQRAIEADAADALLLKVNQIGTLTEAARALTVARDAGWSVTVSARSGETEDDWLADVAVGWSADFIKIGSITQSERLAKYNRLLSIEAETGWTVRPLPAP